MYQSNTNIEQCKGKSFSIFNYFAVLTFKMCCIKKAALKNFAKFTEKNVCHSHVFIKVKSLSDFSTGVFHVFGTKYSLDRPTLKLGY